MPWVFDQHKSRGEMLFGWVHVFPLNLTRFTPDRKIIRNEGPSEAKTGARRHRTYLPRGQLLVSPASCCWYCIPMLHLVQELLYREYRYARVGITPHGQMHGFVNERVSLCEGLGERVR